MTIPAHVEDYELVNTEHIKVGDFVYMFTTDVCITEVTEVDANFLLFEYTRDTNAVGARIKSRGAVMYRRKET